ncbi:MAG: chromosomal replication initiator protein DnaA [Anaerocolumna aminovalerica]|jgi:chromosomal replication initiator protein|uniref:chromosomal replication initiator protein DnaA n=1 Tax=Anaerocolumna aminovalerica TaxID=1527 RepID=UPI000BE2269E|nr:chromosomal replication initiator protein DnaA [Anaerocolumna aminovalerica]MBU5333034.1 chromosomal replication initiator protein DnaA [Anaerocolumna aminovalerica]MDU6266307.1 chromosomal replication initiator protein DnaA [Anaerocolumna aminovalerica]
MNEIQDKWDEILEYLKIEHCVTDVSFKTWLLPLKVYSVDDNLITISIDDKMIGPDSKNFISRKYGVPLKVAISEIMNHNYNIEFVLESQLKPAKTATESDKKKNSTNNNSCSFLNPRYTFDTFVVGANNNLAHAASLAVAESPAEIYNPLFIYGGVGLGKTHLMHSIAHYILEQNPQSKVMYVTSEKFTNELIESIRNVNTTPTEFREKYRNIDVLLIDDIQFIIGKESTQEEFFHTFNTLHESKKQIIISSDKPPKDILTLEERLRSRFEWGLTVDIQQPDYETRMAILKKKEELDGLQIDNEVMKYIATNIKSNIRELEGALTKIVALSRLKKKEVNVTLAEEALKDLISPEDKKQVTPELIIDVIAEHFNITSADIYSVNKSRNIAFPRQIAMYLSRKLTDYSLAEIGKLLGNRDHTTVLHGIDKVEKTMKKDLTLQNTIDVLNKKINP